MDGNDWIVVRGEGGGCYIALREPVNSRNVFVAPDGLAWLAWAVETSSDVRYERQLDVQTEGAACSAARSWAEALR